ncbi:helix-turn-helix domain-containing protein [Frondihabitans sp. VKM Ac-2883]|uniref:helix-turn-helix domain-containing protein n=1 Tax=Frondihabitans sp. VKM Ac-2883 TaxID=2783823 RepID=UPI00188C9283|nr:helix-turn-helix domain-containing protein [Frondihabitans sp. VKM Ac-2883]
MDKEKAMSVAELGEWLNISRSTVYTLTSDPLFPSFKVGREWRFWPSDVKAYLDKPLADLWARPSRRKVDQTRRTGKRFPPPPNR